MSIMKRASVLLIITAFTAPLLMAQAKDESNPEARANANTKPGKSGYFTPESTASKGIVTVEGARIDYDAVAGTLVIHPKGWDDAAQKPEKEPGKGGKDDGNPTAEASMFYVAYFKHGADPSQRPVTFLFNGGPGSATVWLHMGAFGPRRVITTDDSHTPAAPYQLVNNDYSLLDASDLVFVDAPGTGFSRIAGAEKEKAFYSVDADAHAFAEFVSAFLSRHGRWNSPKYLFGESYGTPRAAVLVNLLETEYRIDFNGVIMLSQILSFDLSGDEPQGNPGIDTPYVVALPTYAATAWYHHKLPGADASVELEPFLREVEGFALNDYARALAQGAALPEAERSAIAQKLHAYTGLPVAYILKADLRINVGEFNKNLLDEMDFTTGRLDTRFSGPTLDPLSKEAEYDPQSAAISSAYVSAFNEYARKSLGYGQDRYYRATSDLWKSWDYQHQPPGASMPLPQAANTMPDLAMAMKYNPQLKILLTGGYFDLATPYFEGRYEMQHLQIPARLQQNIEYRYYPSGHMIYAHQESLKALHADVADFIRSTDNVGK